MSHYCRYDMMPGKGPFGWYFCCVICGHNPNDRIDKESLHCVCIMCTLHSIGDTKGICHICGKPMLPCSGGCDRSALFNGQCGKCGSYQLK